MKHILRFPSRMDNFLDFHYPFPMAYVKHSCQDKRLIKKIVLTDGMFMYQIGNPSKNTRGRWTGVAASHGRESFAVLKMKFTREKGI